MIEFDKARSLTRRNVNAFKKITPSMEVNVITCYMSFGSDQTNRPIKPAVRARDCSHPKARKSLEAGNSLREQYAWICITRQFKIRARDLITAVEHYAGRLTEQGNGNPGTKALEHRADSTPSVL
jgi:hypothetical protein